MIRFSTRATAFLISATICCSQAINISGVVRDSAGNGIEEVLVRLGKADLAATTREDGYFIISGTSLRATCPARRVAGERPCPFILDNKLLKYTGTEPAEINLTVFDCKGTLLFSHFQAVSAGSRSITLPSPAAGIHLIRVSVNRITYVFRRITETGTQVPPAMKLQINPTREAQAGTSIDDALLFTREGYRLSRLPVTTPDTARIQVQMPPLNTGTVADIDGNIYHTTRYGNQEWTVENLRTSKYNDGESIPFVGDSATWKNMSTPGYCFFDYSSDTSEQRKWGAFYNAHAVLTGKLAPAGWHVATDEDWEILQNHLIASGHNFDGTIAGNTIAKSIASTLEWLESPDAGTPGSTAVANNASGFSGLPNGYCDYDGYTYYRNWYAFWWTSTPQDTTFVKIRGISYSGSDLKSTAFTKVYGLSVRLVRD